MVDQRDKAAEEKNPGTGQSSLYFDGECPLCRAFTAGHVPAGGTITPHDIRREELPAGLSRADAEQEIHLVDENGVVLHNIDAILAVVERTGRWPLLPFLARIPGMRWVMRMVYRVIAANRYRLFRGPP